MRRAAALVLLLLATPAAAAPPVAVAPDFPCAGCVLRLPAHPDPGPRPLLVALHGDGGGVAKLVRALETACDQAGVILLAPRCPRDLGCTAGSFWQWLPTAGHDPAWLGAQIDAVAAREPVDPARIYAAGYSGGATYLGWYVPTFPTRFAAVAHLAGGAPLGGPCPACKVPVLFLIGGVDPMIVPYTAPLRRYYEACGGHELLWQTLPGVTHEGILDTLAAGRARDTLAWLLARPAACAPALPDAGAGAGARDAAEAANAAALETLPAPPLDPAARPAPAPPRARPAAGCVCAYDAASPGAPVLAGPALLLALAARRRRRADRS